ncbi:MAG: 50S ribosomal protein L21 [Deltaproteobacteria bacterium]|nr:MAG: 50S ribosomal protein L21 [Deltaproteobacteria bacterium]
MYGVVQIGGHQYKVQAGDVLDVQKLSDEAGSTIELDQVLFIGGENAQVGAPTVKGAKVTAKVIKHDKSRKVLVSVRKPGRYRKTNGHRQQYTSLLITELNDGAGNSAKIDAKSKNAEKFLK